RRRGGLGLRRRDRLLVPGARLTTMLDREQVPPWGAFGGEPGETFRVTLNPGGPGERRVRGKESVSLAEGDVILLESSGGGGYGTPEATRPLPSAERV
ncbi:MAG: hydantoinase B/oxoprolinase family protein, partial [Nitrospinota bacterium]